ncbi:unnamed protein product, partial [Aphanomyces euteiches]
RLSHEIHAVSKSESVSPVSTNGFDSPKSAPDSTHRLLLELRSSINAMASEVSEVKESIADSTSNQAFGRAVKYTTTPTSDNQAHCEFFMKQLINQADRCQLDDPDRKMLLGIKLPFDKVHPALNQWWIALSKTKNGDVWSEIYDNFMDRFCNRTPRELVDNLFEDSERLEGESVKTYAIRLQSILNDLDVPDHQGVVIFKRGVRYARAESCLENTDKDLCSIADCMKLLRTRRIRLDDPPVYRERMRSRSGSASTMLTSSRSNLSGRSAPSTPEQSPRPNRRNSKVGFREDPTLAKILEAIHTNQTSQQAFVAQIQQLIEALTKPATRFFAAPVQAQMDVPYAYPSPYAPGFQQQPTLLLLIQSTTQQAVPARSRPRTDLAPVMITTKPDDMTTSGIKTALESSSVATCVTKSVTTSASMSEPAQSASKSATLRRVAHPVQPTRHEIAAPGRLLRKQDAFWYARLNTFPTCPRQMHLILLIDDSSGGSHDSTHNSLPTSRPKQTDSVRSPKSQSTPDIVNPTAPEPVPVFTDEEITDMMESHLEFPKEEYSKEIEERLYPITKSDVRKQLERIRKRQIDPTHEEILRSLDLSEADSHLLIAPAGIEDETLWLKWFADTLEKCDEARRASRDFNNTHKHPLARVSWIDPNPYAVLDMDDPY